MTVRKILFGIGIMLLATQPAYADEGRALPRQDAVSPKISMNVVGIPSSSGVRSCRGVLKYCTIESRKGVSLQIKTHPVNVFTGARLRIERLWRDPNASKLRRLAPFRISLKDGDVAAQVPAGQLVKQPGLWCMRAVIERSDGTLVRSSLPCLRWRPSIEIGWAGDIVVGSHYGLPPNGGRDQFSQVEHLLKRPDLMIGNYEGTLSRGGVNRCNGGARCFIFQSPPERAKNLARAGFDVMTLANNHGLDKGENARRQTVAAIRRYGMQEAGLPGQVTYTRVADTVVAIVGFSPYSGTTSMRDLDAVRKLVRSAQSADVVVAQFHAGLEGSRGAHVPRGLDAGTNTRAAAHAAVDAGANVVLGSGPHVVRGIERYRNVFIVYSAGNFAGWHNFALSGPTRHSGVVRVTLSHQGLAKGGAWDPVMIDAPGIPRPDRSGTVLRRVAALSRSDFGSRAARFNRRGSFR